MPIAKKHCYLHQIIYKKGFIHVYFMINIEGYIKEHDWGIKKKCK